MACANKLNENEVQTVAKYILAAPKSFWEKLGEGVEPNPIFSKLRAAEPIWTCETDTLNPDGA